MNRTAAEALPFDLLSIAAAASDVYESMHQCITKVTDMKQTLSRSKRLLVAVALAVSGAAASAQEEIKAPTWPFQYDDRGFKPGSVTDLRRLNEKIAGETGFIRLTPDGNGFALGDGKPVRFWAVVTDVYRQPPADMAKHARFLASLGVNMVRLHTQIAPAEPGSRATDVNQKEIDGIWRCVAAMKREGIYCTISPYWATEKEAAGWGIDGYGKEALWGLLFFNPKLQAGYRAWVKALYSPKNPYTGIPLAQDPAVAIIQVQNEDSLFFWTMQAMKPEQQRFLGSLFAKWLVRKYGALPAALQAWDRARVDGDDIPQGVLGLYPTWFLTQPQTGGAARRAADQTQFFAETQRKFYGDITDYYRKDLGCKQLVNASNWITADPIRLNDLERYTYTATDVLAVNKYTGGVHTGDNNGWRIDPGHHFTNQSCLLDPRALPTNLKQPVGHPFLITESTWVNPEGYQSEGPFLMAAYQSLTGVDAFYWFAAGGTPEYDPDPYFNFVNINGQHALSKWTCATPELMGSFPANALIYRLGYIRQGEPAVHEERSLASMWQRSNPILAEDRTFDPNRDTGSARGESNLQKGVDPLAFLVGPVEVKYGGDPARTRTVDLSKYIDRVAGVVRSVTGEIRLDSRNGLFTVNAPKAQGASGFLKTAPAIKLSDVTIRCKNGYATIVVVPLDDKPLSDSRKVLVQVGTYARPTGWQSRPATFTGEDGKQSFQGYEIVKTGAMPWQITATDATLEITNPHLSKATRLDTAGYPAGDVNSIASRSGVFTIKLPPDGMYTILE